MTFDEFEQKFSELKEEFKSIYKKYPETIMEFDSYLIKRKYSRKPKKALKSLKGLDI
jgi:hypothetical protein